MKKVAKATVALLGNSRKQRSVGALNHFMSFGFRAVPAVYDLIAAPLMKRFALDDTPVTQHSGNLFDPSAEPVRSGR